MDLFGGVTLNFDDCYERPKGGKHIAHVLFLNQLHMYFNSSAIFKLQNKLHQIVSICLYANVQINIDELTKEIYINQSSNSSCIQLHSRKPETQLEA